jgi:dipeptidyl aminopeptidase/acylaminoacyl peptidase
MAWPEGEDGFYLISNQDREFTNLAWYDVGKKELRFLEDRPNDLEAIEVSGDGRYLARVDNVDGYGELTLLDRKTGKTAPVPGIPKGLVTSFNWAEQKNLLAFTFVNDSHPADIWTWDVEKKALAQVTRSALGGIPASTFSDAELVSYTTFDGRSIPGFLQLPPGARKDGSLAVIVSVHGGPESQSRPFFSGLSQYFLSRGYGIFAPNIRGSTGYGKAFTHLDDVEKRGDSIQDVIYAARFLKESGWADPRKVVVMGGSYGGYMTLAALSMHPDEFAAGIDIVGIANFESFLKNTGAWRVRFREAEYGSLEKDLETLRKWSPIHYADRIKAPLFVIQGANDPRVPQSEAEQIVESIRKRNGVVEYLLFPDEGHGLAKLPNRIKAYTAVADFLDKHVQGGS